MIKDTLIINPFLEIHVDGEEETDFLLFAPRKNVGLQLLRINESENKELFEIVRDYSKIGFHYIDIEKDFAPEIIELFKQNAILINAEDKSEKPLFSCQLSDVNTSDIISSTDLIVNPTFHFEPMKLANFKDWIYHRHFSPQQATVWIKNPITNIEIGFWLDQKQAETLSIFERGQEISNKIDEELLAKLIASNIIVSKKEFEQEKENWQEIIKDAQNKFHQDKYIVIENLLPKSQIGAMQMFYKDYISQGFMQFGDEFVEKRFRQHNEPLARQFHYNFASLMSAVTQENIIPSYCYAASYLGGAELKPHTDRDQCEFSISFQVDYEPSQTNDKSPWELFLATPKETLDEKVNFEWDEFGNNPQLIDKTTAIELKNGDGLFYQGRELIHFRYQLPQNHKSTSLFFHYVAEEFTGDLK